MGDVERISPEAPVPIIKKKINKQNRLGGAGNVALNLQGLGIQPLLIGNIGKDDNGKYFLIYVKNITYQLPD